MKIHHLLKLFIGAFFVLSIYSCEKTELSEKHSVEEFSDAKLYQMSVLNNVVEVESIDKESIANYLQNKKVIKNDVILRNGNSQKAVGLLKEGNDMTTFNAIKNKGGVHGQSNLTGDNLINVQFDSECLLVLDNKAYWGGSITVWQVSEALQGLPFDVGWQIYWSVIDNGEGSGSDPDLVGDAFIIIPPGEIASNYGFETWCHYADFDYNLLIEGVHYPHGYEQWEGPANIQVK